jgi:para-aminobenzoate synthetase component 1
VQEVVFLIENKELFQQRCLYHFRECKNLIFINRNSTELNYIAVSNSNESSEKDWRFGFISYDYKNKIESLKSDNFDGIVFPEKHFFSPEILFIVSDNEVVVRFNWSVYDGEEIRVIIEDILSTSVPSDENRPIQVSARIEKTEYLQKVKMLKSHIKHGDIYEVNFCHEFYAQEIELNPVELYFKLNGKSPTPFSGFLKCEDKFLLCASPERFIKKEGSRIFSQPIKGTIKRGRTEEEDRILKETLLNDEKERSENIMIVDLVRNDLGKIAQRNTVEVDELCEIYTFPQVHQMISTVGATLKNDVDFNEIIQATFPMGSMTGAPKIRAMELIEEYEETKRGIYSGSIGYITPENDFDFNVVIRSITYNKRNKYLSYIVGGAITDKSVPEKEYDESLLKAKAMIEVLG